MALAANDANGADGVHVIHQLAQAGRTLVAVILNCRNADFRPLIAPSIEGLRSCVGLLRRFSGRYLCGLRSADIIDEFCRSKPSIPSPAAPELLSLSRDRDIRLNEQSATSPSTRLACQMARTALPPPGYGPCASATPRHLQLRETTPSRPLPLPRCMARISCRRI